MKRRAEGRTGTILMLVIVVILIAALPAWAVETQTGGGLQVQLFADLNDDSASVYINYLAGKSIIKGFDDGTFRPGEGLTRAQAAVLMTRAAGIAPDSTADLPFTDVAADYWAKPSIATSVKAGYIKGLPDNSFHPEEKLTRAQAAAMVLRLSRQSLNKAPNAQFSD
ncbi:MAG TPA: S-layer homology domain-containing protein, partial [Syntrophomonas sp.]|nr:S-layer homology domain-containing protein [Syntrophomonas sp.]